MSAIDEVLAETWRVGDPLKFGGVSIVADDGVVCWLEWTHGHEGLAEARAAVASQAPELYRVLAAIVDAWSTPNTGWDIVTWPIEDARALLASIREAAGD